MRKKLQFDTSALLKFWNAYRIHVRREEAMSDVGRRKCTLCTCMRGSRLEQRDIFRDGEEGRSVHISAKNVEAGHSEANTAAREAGGSRMMPGVLAPVLVLHRSKHSA